MSIVAARALRKKDGRRRRWMKMTAVVGSREEATRSRRRRIWRIRLQIQAIPGSKSAADIRKPESMCRFYSNR